METPVRILVVDDDDLFREGLSVLFAREPNLKIVGRAATGAEGTQKARRLQPDVVLSELKLPDMDGVAFAKSVRQEAPDAHVALMAKRFSRTELMSAINAGVRGYITKDVGIPTLIDAIRHVARGEYFIPSESSPVLLEELASRDGALTQHEENTAADRAKVTEREREVLQLLVQGATNRDIARRLSITENTVKVHLRNILDKLHLRNRQQAAAFAISSGLVKLNRDEGGRRPRGEDRMPATTWRRQEGA